MESTKFEHVFKLPRLKPIAFNKDFLEKVVKENKFNSNFVPAEGVTVGIEYEIENCPMMERVPDDVNHWDFFNRFWTVTTDGSLRGAGAEFVSRPVTGPEIRAALVMLDHYLGVWRRGTRTSHRTGIHVHVNASDLNVPQIFGWVALYQVFERMLYKYSGSRDQNIYCLPTSAWDRNIELGFKSLPSDQGLAVVNFATRGHKYAGLNALPLQTQGTLEFRMMHTIHDIPRIGNWVDYLTNVKSYSAEKVSDLDSLIKFLEALGELNTSSKYHQLLETVFPTNAGDLLYNNWERDIAAGVTQVKENLTNLLSAKEKIPKVEKARIRENNGNIWMGDAPANAHAQNVIRGTNGERINWLNTLPNRGLAINSIPENGVEVRNYWAAGPITQDRIRQEMAMIGAGYTPARMNESGWHFLRRANILYTFYQ